MADHVFKVDELATQIATNLLAISRKSVVALALTCRALEDPTLRVLWETQDSLGFLITRVLPTEAWRIQDHPDPFLLVGSFPSSGRPTAHEKLTGIRATTHHVGVG